MNDYIKDREYLQIVKDIMMDDEFIKLKKIKHHGDNRRDHCLRVSYECYRICKKRGLHYKEIARAALLHDFFLIKYEDLNYFKRFKLLFTHPKIALENAEKITELSEIERNIIESHMFPIGRAFPKYKESWLIGVVDDYVAIYERLHYVPRNIRNYFRKEQRNH